MVNSYKIIQPRLGGLLIAIKNILYRISLSLFISLISSAKLFFLSVTDSRSLIVNEKIIASENGFTFPTDLESRESENQIIAIKNVKAHYYK